MATKKSVDTVREELRVLNSAADDGVATASSGLLDWRTADFWTMAATAVTNIVAVSVLVGWISQTQAEELTKALTALVGATQVIVLNSVLVWKYLSGRQALQVQIVASKYRYMEIVAHQKLQGTDA